jgi:hypothetical protein
MAPPDRTPPDHTPAARDAALHRLRRVNRGLVALAIAATAVLTDVAAHAFPGHSITRTAVADAATQSTTKATAVTVPERRHHTRVAALRAPASAPEAASSSDSSPATSSSSQAAQTPVAVAPAPVVSGGS